MANRSKKQREDNRLDWRDPDMPVLVLCDTGVRYPDGRIVRTGVKMMALTPEQRRSASEQFMRTSIDPHWRSDPTYDLANPRNRRKKR